VTTWSTQDAGARRLARSVSHLLRTVTRIYPTPPDDALMASSGDAVPLLLKLDNTRCVGRCFLSARSAATFLAVYHARQLGTLNLTSVAGQLSS